MQIYDISKENVVGISEIPFDSEREIQRLVEDNMQKIFTLDFVTSEFELGGWRIDSLGFDNESKSFTIIEYKKERNFSVIDQGFAYLSLLVNNKAEFILKFNENKNNRSLKKNDVDWSQSRVIFVSPVFTDYQKKSIEFKGMPIELWEVKKYSNLTVLFNKIQVPKSSESIAKITQQSEVVKKVSQEIKVYDEESHLSVADKDINSLYNELKELVFSIGDDITLKYNKKYIAFVRNSNFLAIYIRKSYIILHIILKKGILNDPKKICMDISKIVNRPLRHCEIKIKDSSNFGYMLSLIRQAYENN